MKRNILLALALTAAALVSAAHAEGISFDNLEASLADLKGAGGAASATVPAPTVPEAAPAAMPDAPAAERDWLVLVFLNGRNDLARAAIMDVNEMEMVGSTDKVAVTAELGLLQDRGNSTRLYIQKDAGPAAADKLGAIVSPGELVYGSDMGNWKHFVDFAKWSYRKYPAKNVLAILWNHGSGRVDIGGADNTGAELGIAYDDLTRNFIRNKQIGLALQAIEGAIGKKVAVYASDACLMQMASVVHQIRGNADFIVGAEENVPGDGFPYDTILADLAADPGKSPEALSTMLVDKFQDYYSATPKNTTLSSIRGSKVAGLAPVLNDWVLAAATPANRKLLLEAEENTLSFEGGYNGNDTTLNARSKDLYDFIDQVNKKAGKSSKLHAKGEAVKKYIETMVIANKTTQTGGDYDRAKGLAVYFPKMIYDPSYDENVFSRDSLWDDYLKWKLDPSYKIR